MSVGESAGGLPPDRLVEREDAILKDTQRLIETHHDEGRYAMLRVVAAPCSPFSVSRDLMRESRRPGPGVWHAHAHPPGRKRPRRGLQPREVRHDAGRVRREPGLGGRRRLARPLRQARPRRHRPLCAPTGTGVAHCPCSNMRLASGIAPIRRMLDAGVPVGLGVDGSASNDSAHLLNEARQAMLLARVGPLAGALWLRPRPGRDDGAPPAGGWRRAAVRGCWAATTSATSASAWRPTWPCSTCAPLGFAGGAVHDPVGALLLLCASATTSHTVVQGRVVVRDGQLTTLDLGPLVERHNRLARDLAAAAP